jgi:hypothetical protein
MVLLGTQAANIGAAAVGAVTFVWSMLPGPSRQAVWKWAALFCISMMATFGICMFLPALAIAMDVSLTNGPDLMVERLLLLDALALVGLVFHRRMVAGIASFGQRMATRMRYAKVGGTHLPGDTSELGAALAMHGAAPGGGGRSGLLLGASGAHRAFGVRHRILGSVAAMADGTGMPLDPGRMLGDAASEARRGLAPLALGAHAGRLALRGAHAALIGPRPPEEDPSLKLLRAIANGTEPGGRPGPRAQDEDGGMIVDHRTGEVLHDPQRDRPLLGSRIHQRASRLRGYRVAARAARFGYGASLGLPRTVQAGRTRASEFTQDARTQLRVVANRARDDADQWQAGGRATARAVNQVTQRAATAWRAYDPAGRARSAARDAAAGAVIYTSSASGQRSTPARTTSSRREDPAVDARRRVFDALMQAQRASWPSDLPQAPGHDAGEFDWDAWEAGES